VIKKSLNTSNRRIALQKQRKIDAAMKDIGIDIPGRYAMRQMIQHYDSHLALWSRKTSNERINYAIKHYLVFFDIDTPFARIKRSDILEWRRTMKGNGLANVSINNYVGNIRTIINKAISNEWYDGPNAFQGIKRIKESPKVIKILNYDETDRLFELAENVDGIRLRTDFLYLKFMLWLGLYAGFRLEEIQNAQSHWFDLPGRVVHVLGNPPHFETKTGERNFSMHPKLYEFLKINMPSKGYLIEPKQQPDPDRRYRYDHRKLWAWLRKESGIKGMRLHELRHTFGTRLLQSGLTLYQLSQILGHSNLETSKIYAHIEAPLIDISGMK
jgi:integrase